MKYLTSKFQIVLWTFFIVILEIPGISLLVFGSPAKPFECLILLVSVFVLFLIMAAASWSYPDLTGNGLAIRNVLYLFCRKEYEYEDIRKVEICRGSIYHWPCIRIYVKSHTKPYFHSLDCMSQDSIPEFLAELREHGVDAECTVKY